VDQNANASNRGPRFSTEKRNTRRWFAGAHACGISPTAPAPPLVARRAAGSHRSRGRVWRLCRVGNSPDSAARFVAHAGPGGRYASGAWRCGRPSKSWRSPRKTPRRHRRETFERAASVAVRLRCRRARARRARRIPLRFCSRRWPRAGACLRRPQALRRRPAALRAVRKEYARRHGIIAFGRRGNRLQVAMVDPRDPHARRRFARGGADRRALAGRRERRGSGRCCCTHDVRQIMERTATGEAHGFSRVADGGPRQPSSCSTACWRWRGDARLRRPHRAVRARVIVRYRIDGVLADRLLLGPRRADPLVARIKVLSGMRIDDRRSPQDGRFTADLGGLALDFRVSSLPTHWGEKIVLRVLTREAGFLDLDDLGLRAADHETLKTTLAKPFGLVLVTGPPAPASRRRSTRCSRPARRAAGHREHLDHRGSRRVPDAARQPGDREPGFGVDFAAGLRALLRQDPDIIMVGEIRDQETAGSPSAARSSAAWSSRPCTPRRGERGRPALRHGRRGVLLASTLTLVIGQPVRRTCEACRESVDIDARILAVLRGRLDFDSTVAGYARKVSSAADPIRSRTCVCSAGAAASSAREPASRTRRHLRSFTVDDEARRLMMERRPAAEIAARPWPAGCVRCCRTASPRRCSARPTVEEIYRVTG